MVCRTVGDMEVRLRSHRNACRGYEIVFMSCRSFCEHVGQPEVVANKKGQRNIKVLPISIKVLRNASGLVKVCTAT